MPPSLEQAFRLLQQADGAGALVLAREARATEPSNPKAYLAEGVALRLLQRFDEAEGALERACALAPADFAPVFERGLVFEARGESAKALAMFERAMALRPSFAPAHFGVGLQRMRLEDWEGAFAALAGYVQIDATNVEAYLHLARAAMRLRRPIAANAAFERALQLDPKRVDALRLYGQYSVACGAFEAAARLFARALALVPEDEALPMFLMQAELLVGHWEKGWEAYRRRNTRRAVEAQLATAGRRYAIPSLEGLRGRRVLLVAEQGLGDVLFFLRFAPALREHASALEFAGDARLHSLLARSGLFAAFATEARVEGDVVPLLTGDLPLVAASSGTPCPPSLSIAPLPQRTEHWRGTLESFGPRPWTGVTWRAGTPRADSLLGLLKEIPAGPLFGALSASTGEVFALQRNLQAGEIDSASRALGRPVHDLSAANADLEDALALVQLLDRHIGVSSTNMHLATAAGATAEVLVPFPPEWRWFVRGDSPWFPGFRVLRQEIDGDWSAALEQLRGTG